MKSVEGRDLTDTEAKLLVEVEADLEALKEEQRPKARPGKDIPQ